MLLSMTVAGIATYLPRQETLATQTWRERPSPSLGSAAASSSRRCHFPCGNVKSMTSGILAQSGLSRPAIFLRGNVKLTVFGIVLLIMTNGLYTYFT
jgi:hypothetical protein